MTTGHDLPDSIAGSDGCFLRLPCCLPKADVVHGSAWAYVPNPNDYIYYTLDDDAMAPRIMAGDTALIHYQQRLCDGDIGLFIYNPYPVGFIAQYKQVGSSIVLHFFNSTREDFVAKSNLLDHLFIIGKVVETRVKW